MRKNEKIWEKVKKIGKYMALPIVACYIITQCTTSWAIPADETQVFCPYHLEHDESCGYIESEENAQCMHSCPTCDLAEDLGVTDPEAESGTVQAIALERIDDTDSMNDQEIVVYADAEEWAAVTIDEAHFEDHTFREIVRGYDTNGNGVLEIAELQSVTRISLGGTNAQRHTVASLKGIEYFKNLIFLDCGFGDYHLETLDVSSNTKLQYLYAYHNRLRSLNIRGCYDLIDVNIQNENVIGGELDLSSFTKLERLDFAGNPFTCLKLPAADENGITHLNDLYGQISALSYIDFNGYTKEQFTNRLDLTNQSLGILSLNYENGVYVYNGRTFTQDTKFYSDESMTVPLQGFQVVNGKLVIDTNGSGAGTAYFRSEASFGLSGVFGYVLPIKLEVKEAKALTGIESLATFGGLVVESMQCSEYAAIKTGRPGRYDASFIYNGVAYDCQIEVVVAIDPENFPDVKFREIVEGYNSDTGNDSADKKILGVEEVLAVTSIQLGGTKEQRHTIASLQGIEYFPELTHLDCRFGNGELKSLDVSSNTKLTVLDAVHNGLTSMNIDGCKELIYIAVQRENQLPKIDVSGCTKLETLSCEGVLLTELLLPNADENGIYHLQELYAHDNWLSYIDLTNYVNLSVVNLSNQCVQINMNWQDNQWVDSSGKIFASGKDGSGEELTKFYKTCDTDWNMNDALGFIVNGSGTVTATEVLPIIYPVYFKSRIPSPAGQEYILNGQLSYQVTGDMLADISYLDFSEAGAKLPENIEELVNFLGLNFGSGAQYTVTCDNYANAKNGVIGSYSVIIAYEQLAIQTKIEVGVEINATNFPDSQFRSYVKTKDTGNDKIDFLTAAELNAVTMIGISGSSVSDQHSYTNLKGVEYFTKLQELDCCYGNLTSLDLHQNTELIRVSVYHNQLTSVDVSGCEKLKELLIQRNVITNLDMTGCTEIQILACEGNAFTNDTFQVSHLTELRRLDCYDNAGLTDINLEHNVKLKMLNCCNSSLQNLDISKNTLLEELNCGYNRHLTKLNLDNNILLKTLYCSGSALTELDLTNNTALTNLACSDNELTELNVNHLTSLKNLECGGNHLTSLDIRALSSDLVVDAEGQTVQKDLAMSYSDGAWKNVAVTGLEPVRSFHTNGTTFYEYDATNHTAGSNQLTAFSVNSSGVLTASKVFAVVDPVYFTTTLYDSTGAARSGKLTGTFTYAPQFTLSGATQFYSSTGLQKELQEANITEEAGLKKLTGSFGASPDLTEIKDAVTVKLTSGSFADLAAGTKGVYTYQVTLGTTSATGKIVVHGNDETAAQQLVVIPATINLTRNFTENYAEAEETVKLVTTAGNIMEDTSKVKITADASFDLQLGASTTEKLSVDVYTVDSIGNANAYTGTTPLAELDKTNKTEQKFQLRSAALNNLTYGAYQGTMKFAISYVESE